MSFGDEDYTCNSLLFHYERLLELSYVSTFCLLVCVKWIFELRNTCTACTYNCNSVVGGLLYENTHSRERLTFNDVTGSKLNNVQDDSKVPVYTHLYYNLRFNIVKALRFLY